MWAYGRGQTDTQTRVTTIHFASSTTHAKCNHFWATACKTVRHMLPDRCLSVCLSVCLVTLLYCGQTVGWIKMPLGQGDIVLDGDPAPPERGTAAPLFGPCLLWPNGWVDQYVTWYGGRPRSRPYCVRRGPTSPVTADPLAYSRCLPDTVRDQVVL